MFKLAAPAWSGRKLLKCKNKSVCVVLCVLCCCVGVCVCESCVRRCVSMNASARVLSGLCRFCIPHVRELYSCSSACARTYARACMQRSRGSRNCCLLQSHILRCYDQHVLLWQSSGHVLLGHAKCDHWSIGSL